MNQGLGVVCAAYILRSPKPYATVQITNGAYYKILPTGAPFYPTTVIAMDTYGEEEEIISIWNGGRLEIYAA